MPIPTLMAGELVALPEPTHCYAKAHGCGDDAVVGVVNASGQVMRMCSQHARNALRQYDLEAVR